MNLERMSCPITLPIRVCRPFCPFWPIIFSCLKELSLGRIRDLPEILPFHWVVLETYLFSFKENENRSVVALFYALYYAEPTIWGHHFNENSCVFGMNCQGHGSCCLTWYVPVSVLWQSWEASEKRCSFCTSSKDFVVYLVVSWPEGAIPDVL